MCFSVTPHVFQGVPKAWSTMRDQHRWEDDGVDAAPHERAHSLHLRPCLGARLHPAAQERLLPTLPSLRAVQDSASQCHPALTEEKVRHTLDHLLCLDASVVRASDFEVSGCSYMLNVDIFSGSCSLQ